MSEGYLRKKLILLDRAHAQKLLFRTRWQLPSVPSSRRPKPFTINAHMQAQVNTREINICEIEELNLL